MTKIKMTVKQAVASICEEMGMSQKAGEMLDHVCKARGLDPKADGTEVYGEFQMRLERARKESAQALDTSNDAKCGQAQDMAWHEVGPGTDPIRYLTQPDEQALRTASVAQREHYGR